MKGGKEEKGVREERMWRRARDERTFKSLNETLVMREAGRCVGYGKEGFVSGKEEEEGR